LTDIDQVDHVLQRFDRSAGIERHARLLAERADRLQRAMDMRPGLDMDGDDVRAGLRERFEIGIAGRDHQVHVECFCGVRPQGLHHVGADGDVRHEMPVHHVDVDIVRARPVDRAYFLAQFGEIGGQDRRRNLERTGHFRVSIGQNFRYHAHRPGATLHGPGLRKGAACPRQVREH
jgi:hypothetical protein